MLKEIMPIQNSCHHVKKRWYSNRDMDLFIWLEHNAPVKFLLSYNKQQTEHAIGWQRDDGFVHFLVNTGETESGCYTGGYKQAPILLALINKFDAYQVARSFLNSSKNIETHIADFIYARLFEYPDFITSQSEKYLNPGIAEDNLR